jgi:hypothetical protein
MVYDVGRENTMPSDKRGPAGGNADDTTDLRPVISCAIDDVALAALRRQQDDLVTCGLCETPIEGQAPASGLMMWTRDGDVQYDEPPLCARCASRIAVNAWSRWAHQDELD